MPKGKTETEVLEAIESIAKLLARKFSYGVHSAEDIKQEAYYAGLRSLKGYDPKRPLKPYLYKHILRRLINFGRDHGYKVTCPCKLCRGKDVGKTGHKDGQYCERYHKWSTDLRKRQDIEVPRDITYVEDEKEIKNKTYSAGETEIEIGEMLSKIDRELPTDLRKTLLQIRDGAFGVSKEDRDEVLRQVRQICGFNEVGEENE